MLVIRAGLYGFVRALHGTYTSLYGRRCRCQAPQTKWGKMADSQLQQQHHFNHHWHCDAAAAATAAIKPFNFYPLTVPDICDN